MKNPIIFSVISTILLASECAHFSSTPIPKSPVLGRIETYLGRLNTGILVLQKQAGSRYTGIRDPGIAIPITKVTLLNSSERATELALVATVNLKEKRTKTKACV